MNPLASVLTKFAMLGFVAWIACTIQSDLRESESANTQLIENSNMDTPWRLTEFGWQNSNLWQHRSTNDSIVTRIHPFVWTAAILLAVLGLMVWSSNEVEMESMTDPNHAKRNRKSKFPKIKPRHCQGCGECVNFCREEFLNGRLHPSPEEQKSN